MNPQPPAQIPRPVADTIQERPAHGDLRADSRRRRHRLVWHLTEAVHARGHQTIAPDLPCDNDTATLDDYAGTGADAGRGRAAGR
jgi:hypothetical protein